MPDPQPQHTNGTPPTLDHVIGQQQVVERVRIALEASWADARRFDHSLLVGPAGTGKTLLATIIGKEMGVEVRECLGQTVESDGGLQATLMELQDKDILFIDEVHCLAEEAQTLLLRAVEQRQLFVPRSSSRRSAPVIPLADFTLLAATTDEYGLLAPLRDRFKLVLPFEFYSDVEIGLLLRQRAQALRWPITDPVIESLAMRSRGTPRIAIRLLDACHRVARSQGCTAIDVAHFDLALRLEGIDVLGLDLNQQRVLSFIHEAGGPVRLNVLASRLGLPTKTVAEVIEPYLIRQGLLDKSDGGRVLTTKGLDHVRATTAARV